MSSSSRTKRSRAAAVLAAAIMAGAVTAVVPVASAAAAGCSDVDFVDARGTGEPGTLGIIVGDPLFAALQRTVTGKQLSSYAVNYPANLDSDSAQKGNADLVNHLQSQASSCPNQKFVLAGYSQGANVVDMSIGIDSTGAPVGGKPVAIIPSSIEPRVAALLLFGNPIRAIGKTVTGVYQARTKDYCADGDPVCGNGANVIAHLTYGNDADDAAAFAAAHL